VLIALGYIGTGIEGQGWEWGWGDSVLQLHRGIGKRGVEERSRALRYGLSRRIMHGRRGIE
jgi:hypothetical protein